MIPFRRHPVDPGSAQAIIETGSHNSEPKPVGPFECFGRDADDAKLMIVDEDVFADDRRVAAEATLPAEITEHDDGMRQARLASSGRKVRPWIGFTPSTSK